MKAIIHALAGAIAIALILTFWVSTLISELAFSHSVVANIKQLIVYGLFILVPCLAITGISGNILSPPKAKGIIARKKKRMAIAAINGLVLMIPLAVLLSYKASREEFDMVFYSLQVIELLIGIVQLTLLGLNFKDGLKLRKARLR